ncbi:MAG: transglutaminase domain-containing protein [Dysgonamonadaceae bacterium]|jgi:transglutaminase-like putative cysteine protease|nr:transglutaminase domain-containing protein [Dysgonamonadaceae bacterium]
MKHFSILALIILFCACSFQSGKVSMEQINEEEAAGHFAKASHLIDLYIAENDLLPASVYELNTRKDVMHRIRLDFDKDKTTVMDYIKKYYPDVNDEMLEKWEKSKTLESKVIDGKKWYFDRAASNLFRLDKDAIARKAEIDKPAEGKESVLKTHLPEVVNTLAKSGKTQASPVKMRVKYELTLQPNAVPDGETVRCWLPYPREDSRRQSNIKLLSVNDSNYVIAPPQYPHRTIYMEKIAKKDEPLKFAIEFSYQHAPEWFNLQEKTIQPYNTQSDLYKIYTAERPPHIVFTDSIQAVSERIVGNETDPYQKVKKIWEWVDVTFPWAGAREYSTIPNIPQYVLENGHGDCGQVTLLFMTLARYNGIPVRWQSGFMMHPGSLNLHDWSEFYIEGIGWIPMDESFGLSNFADNDDVKYFYSNGMDAYRWIVNSDFSQPLFPNKTFLRGDDVDFQRGELEWRGGNIYYDQWNWDFDVTYE